MYRLLVCIGAISLVAAIVAAPAAAGFGTHCSEPDPPWCLNASLDDTWSFDRCRSEMESYVDQVDRYVDCLNDAAKGAVRRSNDAVRRFNCKAKGGICF